MDAIKDAVSVISITLILYGLMSALLPESSINSSFKYFISVVIISTIILCIKGTDINSYEFEDIFQISNDTVNVEEIDVSKLEKDYVDKSLEQFITEQINPVATNPFSLSVDTDISNDGYISINEIIIVCKKEDKDSFFEVINNLGLTAVFRESDGKG